MIFMHHHKLRDVFIVMNGILSTFFTIIFNSILMNHQHDKGFDVSLYFYSVCTQVYRQEYTTKTQV
jgi:hypothetical protein